MADLSINPSGVLASSTAVIDEGIAGANITAGQALYIDSTDSNKLKLCQNTASKTNFAGISLQTSYTGQPVKYVKEDLEFTPGATVAVGVLYTNANTSGGIRPDADNVTGNYVTAIGIGISTTKMTVMANAKLRSGNPKA